MLVFPMGMKLSLRFGSKATMFFGGMFAMIMVFMVSYTTNPFIFLVIYPLSFGFAKGMIVPSVLRAA